MISVPIAVSRIFLKGMLELHAVLEVWVMAYGVEKK